MKLIEWIKGWSKKTKIISASLASVVGVGAGVGVAVGFGVAVGDGVTVGSTVEVTINAVVGVASGVSACCFSPQPANHSTAAMPKIKTIFFISIPPVPDKTREAPRGKSLSSAEQRPHQFHRNEACECQLSDLFYFH